MSSLHFDPYQFAGRRSKPVAAEFTQDGWTSNGIAFEDYERMQAQSSSVTIRLRRWRPAFAASDEKLRRVLMQRAWLYIHHARHAPRPADWKSLNELATKKALEFGSTFKNCPAHKRCESAAHIAAVKHAGGYLELQAALAYRAWRLGQDSVGIAEALHMSPQGVRVNLQRMCDVARGLGYETFERHSSFQRTRIPDAPRKQRARKRLKRAARTRLVN